MRADSRAAEEARRLSLADVVHNRRLAARLTLAQLAERTDLSPSFLSQFENGRTNTSLRSLQRIADALGTTATELLAAADPTPDEPVVRAGAAPVLAQTDPSEDGSVRALVHGRRDLRALEFTGGTGRGEREFAHENDELIYIVRGSITLVADGDRIDLSTGDAYYCTAGVRHRWWAHTDDTITLLLAVADGLVVRHPPHRRR
ncbi:helix-turn-helix domain-containing protein [Nocardia sp. CDC159]|uniref:Helix-turn-helix domain-containing protein n=1 Tax=Nocardia pulmonis TaxID=2951408 RepID=A0A9X2ECS3_9NOCA|nr:MULTISPECIES: cupin domain-containing protein [Nocardia]MCM6775636.1 helix-turn-helix domain-containing protein [Nocardia pulmonis]MCM6788388.1 helix-turn-helix domain-containing protein [Nocardia sp. CDC159]